MFKVTQIVLALALLIGSSVSPASAHDLQSGSPSSGKWTDLTLTYCLEQSMGSHRKDMFREAFEKWENITPITFTEDCGPLGIFFDIQVSEEYEHWEKPEGTIATTGYTPDGSVTAHDGRTVNKIKKAHIMIFERHFPIVRYQRSNPDCWMFPPGTPDACTRIDGWTTIVHEVGHAIGLSDLAVANCEPGYLSGGIYWYYYYNQRWDACDTNGRRLMNGWASVEGWSFSPSRNVGYRIGAFDPYTIDSVHDLYGSN